MRLPGHFGPRQRFLLLYAAILAGGALSIILLWPREWLATAAMLALSMLAAWIVARLSNRSIRRSMHELREAADAISSGDLARHVRNVPHDDFIKLVESLDRMAAVLRENIREQDRLRQQLTRSEKLALIGELAATVAHEVNNPLDGLQNSTRIIRRNLQNMEQVRQLLDLMDSGLYRIEMIVRRLLTMSRDEPVHLMPTRVDEILSDAVVFVQPRLDRQSIELARDFPEPPLFVQADRAQFAQVLINLMINAADSMPAGGTMTVRCRTNSRDQWVVLEVQDTGTGIAPEHLPHIFEPFYTTKSKTAGTGLGLAVVKRIVEAHRGRISLTSEVGAGTCFRIDLPGVAVVSPPAGAMLPVGTVTPPASHSDLAKAAEPGLQSA